MAARNIRTAFIYALAMIVFFVSVYHNLFRDSISGDGDGLRPSPASFHPHSYILNPLVNQAIGGDLNNNNSNNLSLEIDKTKAIRSIPSLSILFPAWEVLVVVSPGNREDEAAGGKYFCVFDTDEISPARFSGSLLNPDRFTFFCLLPTRFRRRLPFHQPELTKSPGNIPARNSPSPELLRWNHVVYDAIATESDVVLFAKGMNKRQGINRDPGEFRCLFGDDVTGGVRTAVTSSLQEVFRCKSPDQTSFAPASRESAGQIKVALEIAESGHVVPSVAYYQPGLTLARIGDRHLLCACTMVYNVAKFLREWVMYHSKIGVEKFFLYDNGSDDGLDKVVISLNREGYRVETKFWLWPKTQEAGFSHSAVHAKNSCKWMMYLDVDEFLYSPQWYNDTMRTPSKSLIQSLLPPEENDENALLRTGQIMVGCYEFGPSNQKVHPPTGVTQGYNCRRRVENRHKSIVLLDAVHESLLNVIHHFRLREGYVAKRLSSQEFVANHYKYQAWPEFKAKFRRRVSAYVVDWTQTVNPDSNDRAPGLGFSPIEPEGWPEKFCEVYDNRLKDLTRRWFGIENSSSGHKMAWQR